MVGDPTETDLKTYQSSNSSSATKTDTPIREIPHSIQVITRAVMNDQQNISISESLRNVSGVIPNNPLLTSSYEWALIRGFRAEQRLDGFTQYYNPGDRESMVNIERIDILKGPKALLYSGGSGSPAGGLVNLISKLPRPEPSGEVGLKIGSNQFYQPFFDLNQPINSQVLFRITGEYTQSESFIDVIETERFNINPALILTYNDTTTLTLQGKVSRWEQPDYQGLPAVGTVSGDFTIRPETFIGPSNIDPSRTEFQGVWGKLEHTFSDIWSLSFRARYTQSEFDQKDQLIFGADSLRADQPFFPPSTWLLTNSELFQKQDEISFVANMVAKFSIGPIENYVLLGVDYSEINDNRFIEFDMEPVGSIDLAEPVFFVPYRIPGSQINNVFVKNTTQGSYIQIQSTLFERVHFIAGVRLSNININYENAKPGFDFIAESDTTKLLPRFGGIFDLDDEFSLFASYSKGMRGHLFHNFRAIRQPDPELSRHIESGIKFYIADQLSGQLAIYQIDLANTLVTDTTKTLRPFQVGEQHSRGFEADLVWQFSDELSVLANYAYTNVEFANSKAGITKGTRLPGVPEHSGRFWASYRFQKIPFRGLSIGAGIYMQSGVPLNWRSLYFFWVMLMATLSQPMSLQQRFPRFRFQRRSG